MKVGAALANSLWIAAGVPSARRFSRAIGNARESQERLLREMLGRHATSAFGRQHEFESIDSPAIKGLALLILATCVVCAAMPQKEAQE